MAVIIDRLKTYIKQVESQYKLGISTEHSHRGALQSFLETCFSGYSITNEPRPIECGAPDYVIQKAGIPVGYIEAKDIGKNLEEVEHTDQLDRYVSALENLILTDYLEFRFFRNGERIAVIRIADCWNGKIKIREDSVQLFADAMESFFEYQGVTIKNPRVLARKMAHKARQLSSAVLATLESDEEGNSGLYGQLDAFRAVLIEDLNPKDFADLYAQTVAYGLFAARMNDATLETFSRDEARSLIPRSNPFLRRLFDNISGIDLDDELVWIVDDLARLFSVVDLASIVSSMYSDTGGHDPFISFYETFLSEYDPTLRRQAGVYYTPRPVVKFIVSGVDHLLINSLGIQDGLSCTDMVSIDEPLQRRTRTGCQVMGQRSVHKVQILDPACGTFAFPSAVVEFVRNRFENQMGAWSSYVEEELIPRLHGFEILMAPYTISFVKLNLLLKQTGYQETGYSRNQRYGIYLTDTLERYHDDDRTLFCTWLTDEAEAADIVKRDLPIFVCLGNPPYNADSKNNGEWIMSLLDAYKKEPGGTERLNERNPKWINDDYVKFLRYAESLIEKNGQGIVAYINPHGWLDNPSFRGVRWHLLDTFDEIYILNLHGNANKGEKCPDGSLDENVFDIRQGVCINFFVKKTQSTNDLARVFYRDLWGLREAKYDFLNSTSFESIDWEEITPLENMFYMYPRDASNEETYSQGISLADLFSTYSMGITSGNDEVVYWGNENDANSVIESVKNGVLPKGLKEYSGWTLEKASADLRQGYEMARCDFRPFDTKATAYTGRAGGWMQRPRAETMGCMIDGDGPALVSTRLVQKGEFHHAFVANDLVDKGLLSGKDNAYAFPLWKKADDTLFEERTSNLDVKFCKKICEGAGLLYSETPENTADCIGPVELFDYAYACLNSSIYIELYSEFLKTDFPRIPIISSKDAFHALIELGKQLRECHLEIGAIEDVGVGFPIDGDNQVTQVRRLNENVYINATQYFSGISDDVWSYFVGNYKPIEKWLKDRKGSAPLSYSDISRLERIASIIANSIRIEDAIDAMMVDIL